MSEEIADDQTEELRGGGLIRSQGGWSQVMSMRRRGQKEAFDERILGGSDFVNKILDDAEARQVRQLKNKRAGLTIQRIIDEECRAQGISPAELQGGSKRRKVSDLRSLIGLRCRDELGLSSAEIARHVGINTSSIIRSIERAERRSADAKHS
jgi:chromosomal replication initiation ATPase DnaA